MALTPVDIHHTQFKTSVRGYNKGQVDEFMHAVAEALETALREKADLQRKCDALQDEVGRVQGIKSTLTDTLIVAQKSADELRATAHKQAELIMQEAEQARVRLTADVQAEAEKCRAEIALLQATRDRFEAEFKSLLSGYSQWLDRRQSEAFDRSEVA